MITDMELNIPDVLEELRVQFFRYRHAVDSRDLAAMNELFLNAPFTMRFGPNGTLIGYDAIAAYRQNQTAPPEPRVLRDRFLQHLVGILPPQ